jgi:hypothetical protein
LGEKFTLPVAQKWAKNFYFGPHANFRRRSLICGRKFVTVIKIGTDIVEDFFYWRSEGSTTGFEGATGLLRGQHFTLQLGQQKVGTTKMGRG